MARENYLKLRRIGVSSFARIAAMFGFAVGIVGLVVAIIAGLLGGAHGAAIGIASGILILIALTIGLFVGGAIEAFLYNLFVKIVGPIKVIMKNGRVNVVDPLSYAKIEFIFSLLIFGLFALIVPSALLSSAGVTAASVGLTAPVIAVVFVFMILVYGFVFPIIWASVYNWLATKIGGVGIVISKGVIQSVDIPSLVKMILILAVFAFLVQRAIGIGVGFALGIHQLNAALVFAIGLVAVILVSVVVYGILGALYNAAAKKIGGIIVDLKR